MSAQRHQWQWSEFAAPEVLDVEGAAEFLMVGKSTIYDLVGKQSLPHRRVGKSLRFSRSALVAWLAGATPRGEGHG